MLLSLSVNRGLVQCLFMFWSSEQKQSLVSDFTLRLLLLGWCDEECIYL